MGMKERDLYWLAGILEGEGSFLCGPPSAPNSPRVSVEMTDFDVIDRVSDLIAGCYISQPTKRQMHHKQSWRLELKGPRAIDLMHQLLPLMSERRSSQIHRAISSHSPHVKRKLTSEQVIMLRTRVAAGERVKALAAEFGIHFTAAYSILRGATYKDD